MDLDTAKEMLRLKSSVMQEALIDKLRESGIEVKSSDISIGSKPLNSEVDDLIEKHFVPTKNRRLLDLLLLGTRIAQRYQILSRLHYFLKTPKVLKVPKLLIKNRKSC